MRTRMNLNNQCCSGGCKDYGMMLLEIREFACIHMRGDKKDVSFPTHRKLGSSNKQLVSSA